VNSAIGIQVVLGIQRTVLQEVLIHGVGLVHLLPVLGSLVANVHNVDGHEDQID